MRKDLKTLFEEFMYESEYIRRVQPKTLKGYKNAVMLFFKLVPDCSLETIDSGAVLRFFKTLQERERIVGKGAIRKGIKKSTVATYWSKLGAFFSWLELNNHIAENPFRRMEYPTPLYEERKFLEKWQLEKLLTAIHLRHDNDLLLLKRNLLIFHLLLLCGLRREELLQLQVRDIDIEKKVLTIRSETSKSGRSRSIPIHSSIMIYLKDYMQMRKQFNCPSLLLSSRGNFSFSDAGLKHFVEGLIDRSGVQFHVHQFRHTFAVNFLKSSNNIVKLKQLLGHRSINMTLIYLRCLPVEEMKKDIECLSIDLMI